MAEAGSGEEAGEEGHQLTNAMGAVATHAKNYTILSFILSNKYPAFKGQSGL